MKKIKKQFLLLIFTDLSLQQIILNVNVLPNRKAFYAESKKFPCHDFYFYPCSKKATKKLQRRLLRKQAETIPRSYEQPLR